MTPDENRELPYSLDRLRAARQARAPLPLPFSEIPDAPYDDPDAVLHVWNGERWVTWQKWLATAPIAIENKPPATASAIPADAACVAGICGNVRVWLVRDGDRWLMFAGSRKSRRKDFASPFLEHAIRTAEAWYGTPASGWKALDRAEAPGNSPKNVSNDGREQFTAELLGLRDGPAPDR